MKETFVVIIEMDGEAFTECSGYGELCSVLHGITERINDFGIDEDKIHVLRDYNGNTCGGYKIIKHKDNQRATIVIQN